MFMYTVTNMVILLREYNLMYCALYVNLHISSMIHMIHCIMIVLLLCSLYSCSNFVDLISPDKLDFYNLKVFPIFQKYPQVFKDDGNVNIKKLLSIGEIDDIINVLINLRHVLPEETRELKILEAGFFLFHFKAKSVYCSEYLLSRNEPVLLRSLLQREEETSFNLVRKVVKQYPPSPLTDQILQLVFEIFPALVNEQIVDYKYGMIYYTHLLHEACYIGNVPAINALLNCGADPKLFAENTAIGLKRSALHFAAYSDTTGIDSLTMLLSRFEWSDEEKKAAASAVISNPHMNEELKQFKLNLLQ